MRRDWTALQRARPGDWAGARVAAILTRIAAGPRFALALGLGIAACAAPALGAAPALAASTAKSGHVAVALLSEETFVAPGRPFSVGLLMRLDAGWHTYWKNPGDAGLPLKIEWRLPEGFSAGPIAWPAPERMPTGSLMSYGYAREVLLPVELVPPAALTGETVTIAGRFDWLECEEVCLAATADLDLTLPVRHAAPEAGPEAPRFAGARERTPRAPDGWALEAVAGPRAVSLAFRPPARVRADGAYFFADQPLVVNYAAPQGFEGTTAGYRVTAEPAANPSGPPARLTGVLVVEGRGRATAVAVDVALAAGDPVPAPVPRRRPGGTAPLAAAAAVAGAFLVGIAVFVRRSSRNRRNDMMRLIALVCLLAAHAPSAHAAAAVGKAAPAFTLRDSENATVRLADFKGRYVVLEWVNFDCPFVGKHYGSGNMQALQKRYTEKGVVWLSICSSAKGKQGHLTGAQAAAAVRERDGAATRFLLDPTGAAGKAYGAKTTPHMFVIDPKGALLYAGAIDDKPSTRRDDVEVARNYVAEALDAAMAGKSVATAATQPYGCSVKY